MRSPRAAVCMRRGTHSASLCLLLLLSASAAGQDDPGTEYEDYDDMLAEHDGEDTAADDYSTPWLQPHYFMRPHMYTNGASARGHPTYPTRQNVLEDSFSVIHLKGGFQLPEDIAGSRVRLDLGKDRAWHKRDLAVTVSPVVVPMAGRGGERWQCHMPQAGGEPQRLGGEETARLIREAEKGLQDDLLRPCWQSATEGGLHMEFCWNRTLTLFELTPGGVRVNPVVMGRMPNRTHAYELVPDGVFIDPLALSTLYTEGDVCNSTDPITLEKRRWQTSVWLHCPQHSSDHELRDRWGPNPSPIPWAYDRNDEVCAFRIDLWSSAACTVTLPHLHLNQHYILCRPDRKAAAPAGG